MTPFQQENIEAGGICSLVKPFLFLKAWLSGQGHMKGHQKRQVINHRPNPLTRQLDGGAGPRLHPLALCGM